MDKANYRNNFNKLRRTDGRVRRASASHRSLNTAYRRRPRVWTIGGGKGGVGKSFIASSLGVMLAGRNNRVLMVDADLGAANLHTLLGVEGSGLPLSSFLKAKVDDLAPVIIRTGVANLELISGANDSFDVADLGERYLARLKKALMRADYDYVILDIGPGTARKMQDFFLCADQGVLVTTPEPTSVENTYRFLKSMFLRLIRNIVHSQEDSRLKDQLLWILDRNVRTIADILLNLKRIDAENELMLRRMMREVNVSIVVNQIKSTRDKDLGGYMEKACRDYFGVDIKHLCNIFYESSVSSSVMGKRPYVTGDESGAGARRSMEDCLDRLVSRQRCKVLDPV